MSFYRKYRPQKFKDVVGQEHVKKTLLSALKRKNISHAYLFAGPRGTGKTTVARLLAKALNCPHRDPEPCNRCLSCKEHAKLSSLDLIEIDAASNRGIDEIRELRERIKLAPSSSPYKVFIIDEVHMLTTEAFNALLKTLEEPPAHAIFILATTEPHKVPATILSRCQRFDFLPLSISEIISKLKMIAKKEKIKFEDDALKMIAAAASGGLRDAESILDQLSSSGKKISVLLVQQNLGIVPERAIIKLYESLIKSNIEESFEVLNRLTEKGYNLINFRQILLEFLRKVLVYKMTGQDLELKQNYAKESVEKIISLSNETEKNRLIEMIKTISEDTILVKDSSPSLGLELAVVELAREDISDEIDGEKEIKETEGANKIIATKKFSSENWNKFLEDIKPYNHSLAGILRSATILGTKGNNLIIGVDYEFYKKKIEDRKNLQVIEELLHKITNIKYTLKCRLKKKSSNIADLALEVFK